MKPDSGSMAEITGREPIRKRKRERQRERYRERHTFLGYLLVCMHVECHKRILRGMMAWHVPAMGHATKIAPK